MIVWSVFPLGTLSAARENFAKLDTLTVEKGIINCIEEA